jgi:hypothetical protein
MRIPITVYSESFDIEKRQPDIDAAQRAFAEYLANVPRKSTRSKHGLMGPVGKILSEIKSGRTDPNSLKGYAIRVHEATGWSPSPSSLESLERGIDTTVSLLAQAPLAFHSRVLDRLDYGLYYLLRKRQAQAYEALRLAWAKWLGNKYLSEEALAAAWDKPGITFEELHVPKKSEGSRSARADARQRDIAEFWDSQGSVPAADEEE